MLSINGIILCHKISVKEGPLFGGVRTKVNTAQPSKGANFTNEESALYRTEIKTSNQWPSLRKLGGWSKGNQCLVIADRQAIEHMPSLKAWIAKFSFVYLVKGGEDLKDLARFPQHIEALMTILGSQAHRGLTVLAIGGGSVGDFAGFVASVFKRGLPLIHIPTTWLAALDSSHGGKTGLNVGIYKNQIGTFYPARAVWLIKHLLLSQPQELAEDAYGELYKMSLLTKKPWGTEVLKQATQDQKSIWKHLPMAIEEKYQIVAKDPYETKGIRSFLNLGHTMGHVFELHFGISHGRAVALGTVLALELSYRKSYLKKKDYDQYRKLPFYKSSWIQVNDFITESKFREIVLQDKKKMAIETDSIPFVFLKRQGHPILSPISIKELVTLGRGYGYIKN